MSAEGPPSPGQRPPLDVLFSAVTSIDAAIAQRCDLVAREFSLPPPSAEAVAETARRNTAAIERVTSIVEELDAHLVAEDAHDLRLSVLKLDLVARRLVLVVNQLAEWPIVAAVRAQGAPLSDEIRDHLAADPPLRRAAEGVAEMQENYAAFIDLFRAFRPTFRPAIASFGDLTGLARAEDRARLAAQERQVASLWQQASTGRAPSDFERVCIARAEAIADLVAADAGAGRDAVSGAATRLGEAVVYMFHWQRAREDGSSSDVADVTDLESKFRSSHAAFVVRMSELDRGYRAALEPVVQPSPAPPGARST